MSVVQLNAVKREETGKGSARACRREGLVPAIVYGNKQENVQLAVSERELTKLYTKSGFSSQLIEITLDKKKYLVLPQSVQLHPVTDMIEHADFVHVDPKSKVKVLVHLHYTNEDKCVGIKRGGVVNVVKRDIYLMCTPDKIPSHIDIDLTDLNINQTLHLNDLKLPAGTAPFSHDNDTIVTVVGRGGKAEEEVAPVAAAAAAPAAKK